MKNLLLTKIEISNWRGQNRVVYPFEGVTTIKGKNGCGKTSVMSAWYWLLSGYTDANTPQNHNLFDTTKELTKDTPTASVKAFVKIDDIEWVLEKRVSASFKRDKTSDEWVKSQSDTYTYLIDGIEVSATDFKEWIAKNICPIEMITFCMCGQFFSNLTIDDKKQARLHLERICGEINIEDLRERDYYSLRQMFAKGYTIEKIKESFKATLKSLRDSLDKLPIEIESKESVIADLMLTDFVEIEQNIDAKNSKLADIDEKIRTNNAMAKSDSDKINAIHDKIASKRAELSKRASIHLDAQDALKVDVKRQIREVEACNRDVDVENMRTKTKKREIERQLEAERKYLASLNDERNRLVMERNEAKSFVFNEDHCAYCGQKLPADKLEDAIKDFNKKKEEYVASIIKQGVAVKEKIQSSEAKIAELEASLVGCDVILEKKDCSELQAKLADIIAKEVPFEETDEYKALHSEIVALMNEADDIREKSKIDVDYTERKREIMKDIMTLNQELGKKSLIQKYQEDVDYLKEKRRELGIECAELEGKIVLCDAFVEEKARLVSNRINEKLEGCEIQMWERLKNGDLTPACVVQSKDGVKLSTINYSRRLLIEAELQKLFCNAYGVKMPIFYDEANVFDSEHKPNSNGWQVFLLQASDDERLIVE